MSDKCLIKMGLMTNSDFFSSNEKGGFYEDMEWDGEKWNPNSEIRAMESENNAKKSTQCGFEYYCYF